MPTRYQQLRQAIANLAAPPAVQRAHLESIFPRYGAPLPPDFNADELGLEFGDIYCGVGDMLEHGEITQDEIDAARPLDELLERWSEKRHGDFWRVKALFDDPRWDEVRQLASKTLESYPDQRREGDHAN